MRAMLRRLQGTAHAWAWAVLLLDLFVLVVWAASGADYFWPIWVWLPTGLVVARGWWAGHAGSRWSREVGQTALVGLFLIGIWAASGGGSFWPVWPIAGLALMLGARAITRREREKSEARVEELTQ